LKRPILSFLLNNEVTNEMLAVTRKNSAAMFARKGPCFASPLKT